MNCQGSKFINSEITLLATWHQYDALLTITHSPNKYLFGNYYYIIYYYEARKTRLVLNLLLVKQDAGGQMITYCRQKF